MQLHVGLIPFLNSEPFYPLLGEHHLVELAPRELGRLADRGEIDAGIMATADFLRLEERYEPIGRLGVANREEVRSILFLSRCPLNQLDGARVGITEETSTSVRLLKLLLEVREGVKPQEYVRGAREEMDAFLVIGNEALRWRRVEAERFAHRYDLASEWWSWKRLPFVFALWVIRRDVPEEMKRDFAGLLERSFAKGMAEIDAIAARHAGEMGSAAELASYLGNFHYRLGDEEMVGLREFRRLVLAHDLLQPI